MTTPRASLPPSAFARASIFTAAPSEPTIRSSVKRTLLEITGDIGPGVVTGAADDDPSGIATYSQAGAQFGYGLLWTMLLTYPLMAAVQLVSAHIGRVTGAGLAKNIGRALPHWIVSLLVTILLIANIFNIGADLSAMAASAQLVVGGSSHVYVILFALVCVGLQLFVSYRRYAEVLKWLTLSLFAYVGVILLVHIDWPQALVGMVWPREFGSAALLTIVAVFGTTISPYLFFWQSSQEAEEIATTNQRALKDAPTAVRRQYRRIRIDTVFGMAFSNIIALAIMLATAATLHAQGVTNIGSAAEAAEALQPIAGRFAFLLFAIGIIGTGLLAVPVLAGSAAFAVGETRGWKTGLEYKPLQAARFYAIIVAATFIGVALDWSNLNPIKALFWSAVLNGVSAVPIMAAMMVVASSRKIMGHLHERRGLLTFGWAATAVMALASGAMLATSFGG
jgi:NRAMP (natural resistance-associated macrophage protein)-like metal ion transporter